MTRKSDLAIVETNVHKQSIVQRTLALTSDATSYVEIWIIGYTIKDY